MKVLIIKLSSIGDVVHTLPALHALRSGLEAEVEGKGWSGGRVEIDWLVEEAASTILRGNPMIDNLYVVRNRGWIMGSNESIKTARVLAARNYDVVLDFQGLIKSGVWVLLSKGKRRIGFSNSREMSHIFLNEKLPPYDPDMHAVERYLELAEHAGGRVGEEGVVFPIETGADVTGRVSALLRKKGIVPGRDAFFALAPHARWSTKLWSDRRFAEFARAAIERYGLKAALVGGPGDRDRLEAMRKKIGERAVNTAGEIDLLELASLFRLSAFAVTVDSGPMHIAAAVGTKTIALFGPTAPKRTGPYGKEHIVISKNLPCSPCFLRKCPDIKCMNEIGVNDLLGAAERLVTGM
jgi:lipopolysaccharide heptosyltransferase II